jgi:hypothetical protein
MLSKSNLFRFLGPAAFHSALRLHLAVSKEVGFLQVFKLLVLPGSVGTILTDSVHDGTCVQPSLDCKTGQLFLVRVLGTSWYWARGVFYW